MATNKLLRGVVRLNSADDTLFTMILEETSSTSAQNQIAPIVVEEVFIECNTTAGDITIVLPPIATFRGGWSPKIFVTVTAGENTVSILPYFTELPDSDYINGQSSYESVGLNATAYLHITEKHNWGLWESCSELAPPPPIA